VATIWDADIIIYLISMLLEEKKKFDKTGVGINPIDRREYDIQAYDVLTFCNRSVGRKAYLDLAKAMNRLSNTKYLTNIVYNHPNDKGGFKRGVDHNLITQTADEIQLENELDDEFSWILSKTVISHRSMNRAGKITKVPYAYKLSLHHRFVHSVVGSSSVLRINEDFFKITGGIERWLYRIARKHEGTDRENQMGFIWPMKHLYERSLSSGTYRKFKFRINQIAKQDSLLDYKVTTFTQKGVDKVHFIDRKRIVLDALDIQDIIRELSARKRMDGFTTTH